MQRATQVIKSKTSQKRLDALSDAEGKTSGPFTNIGGISDFSFRVQLKDLN